MGIYTKLSTIQKSLIAPKGQYNSFGKYNYRSCEDILQALKPLCDEVGCVVYITNDLQQIGANNYVKATVTLTDLESGEAISSTAHAREEETKKGMDGSQITGASSSYARKYALAGLFCIDNEKDSDATNGAPEKTTQPVKEAKLKTRVLKFINSQNFSKDNVSKICESFGAGKPVSEWGENECNKYISFIESKGGNI